MEHDIRHYDLESVPMNLDPVSQNPKLLTLEVGAWIGGGDGGLSPQAVGRIECCSCLLGKTKGKMKMFLPPPPEGSAGGSVGILCPKRGSE